MPIFLSRDQVYRMLQRELPPNVYPDGAPSAYFSTAENDSVAAVAASAYTNAQQIYYNFWPQTCDDSAIVPWEIKVFGYQNDASLGLLARQNLVIERIRTRRGLTISDMLAIVLSIIGTDKIVEIIPWSAFYGSWILNDNQLGISTWLGSGPRLQAVSPLACDLGPAAFGLTADQWKGIQDDAYSYSVLIYAYVPTGTELAKIDQELSIYEPARSKHYIFSGLDPANQVLSPPFFLDGGFPDSDFTDITEGGSPVGAGPDIVDGGNSF